MAAANKSLSQFSDEISSHLKYCKTSEKILKPNLFPLNPSWYWRIYLFISWNFCCFSQSKGLDLIWFCIVQTWKQNHCTIFTSHYIYTVQLSIQHSVSGCSWWLRNILAWISDAEYTNVSNDVTYIVTTRILVWDCCYHQSQGRKWDGSPQARLHKGEKGKLSKVTFNHGASLVDFLGPARHSCQSKHQRACRWGLKGEKEDIFSDVSRSLQLRQPAPPQSCHPKASSAWKVGWFAKNRNLPSACCFVIWAFVS